MNAEIDLGETVGATPLSPTLDHRMALERTLLLLCYNRDGAMRAGRSGSPQSSTQPLCCN